MLTATSFQALFILAEFCEYTTACPMGYIHYDLVLFVQPYVSVGVIYVSHVHVYLSVTLTMDSYTKSRRSGVVSPSLAYC